MPHVSREGHQEFRTGERQPLYLSIILPFRRCKKSDLNVCLKNGIITYTLGCCVIVVGCIKWLNVAWHMKKCRAQSKHSRVTHTHTHTFEIERGRFRYVVPTLLELKRLVYFYLPKVRGSKKHVPLHQVTYIF